jgi:hypothetical protein
MFVKKSPYLGIAGRYLPDYLCGVLTKKVETV